MYSYKHYHIVENLRKSILILKIEQQYSICADRYLAYEVIQSQNNTFPIILVCKCG